MSKVLLFAGAALVVITGLVLVVTALDLSNEDPWNDGSMYITATAVVYVAGDALRRALR